MESNHYKNEPRKHIVKKYLQDTYLTNYLHENI